MATLPEVLRQAGYVTPQGQVVGPRTDLAQKLKSYVMNIPQNAAQNLANQRADIDAALTMGQGGIQIGDREAFARQMAEVPNLMGAIAYHGTPHTIKGKFDISKVGTGEGAQAYGHGMYFAENPAVAESYKIAGAAKYGDPDAYANMIVKTYSNNPDKALKVLNNIMPPQGQTTFSGESRELVENAIKSIQSGTYKGKEVGNLYKVDIPDEYIPTMMDYDKPLGQQNDVVKKALNEIKKQITPEMRMELGGDMNLLFGKDVTPVQFLNTMEIIHPTGGVGIGEKMLNDLGVKGIRYKDAMSRGADEGTYNFVVFDPSEVKILEQNSKPMTRKEIIEQELEKVSK